MRSDFRFVIGALLAFAMLGVGSTDAVRKGNDFPTIRNTLLKSHLVEGIPRQRVDGNRSLLADIRLITGERLVFDGEGKRFSVG